MGFLRKRSLCRRYVAYEPGPRRLAGIVVGCLHVTPTLAAGHNGGRGGGGIVTKSHRRNCRKYSIILTKQIFRRTFLSIFYAFIPFFQIHCRYIEKLHVLTNNAKGILGSLRGDMPLV